MSYALLDNTASATFTFKASLIESDVRFAAIYLQLTQASMNDVTIKRNLMLLNVTLCVTSAYKKTYSIQVTRSATMVSKTNTDRLYGDDGFLEYRPFSKSPNLSEYLRSKTDESYKDPYFTCLF